MIEETKLAQKLIESTPAPIAQTGGDIWGLILGDRMAYFRRKNSMKLSRKLHDEAKKLGGKIDTSRIPDQFAFEWTEAATKKDDDTLQDMFTKLLLNSATDETSADERLIYALQGMVGEDAKLFLSLYKEERFQRLSSKHGLPDQDQSISMNNLVRLNLVREITAITNEGTRPSRSLSNSIPTQKLGTRKLIQPSALGKNLYRAVSEIQLS